MCYLHKLLTLFALALMRYITVSRKLACCEISLLSLRLNAMSADASVSVAVGLHPVATLCCTLIILTVKLISLLLPFAT